MSEKLVRCFAHWERRGEAVSEGLHLVHGEWMCGPCFTGRALPVRGDYDQGKKTATAILLGMHMGELGIEFAKENHSCASRKWTVNYLLKCGDSRTAIESRSCYFKNPRGKVIRGGRHNCQKRVERDWLKYSTAAVTS